MPHRLLSHLAHVELLTTDLDASVEFAVEALKSPDRGALFLRLDGKDYRPGLWQLVRPAGDGNHRDGTKGEA